MVATSQEACVRYNHNDLPHLKKYSDRSKHEASIRSFKLAFGSGDEGVDVDGLGGDVGFLIGKNMLLTGFDAPVEQVLANHTPRFWNIVRSQIADADKAKQWLKEHGQILEEDI